MIDPKAITTYAQYNEDIILYALLHDVKKGFYVDVGANYPTIDSVTKLFYDKGWTGINIEPIKSLYKQFLEIRPNDINLQCGAGDKPGKVTLREYTEVSGHSTFDPAQKKQHDASLKYTDYDVDIKTLESILDDTKPKHVHFIKIDVEGFEFEVVAGNNWTKYRPEVVCIEANHVSQDWRKILKDNKYRLFIGDGLNEYYVANESWHRTNGFEERIISVDYHALKQHQWQSWSQDSHDLLHLTELTEQKETLIRNLQQRVVQLEASEGLSLKDRPLRSRLKRAGYGLTVDWLRFKRTNKRG